MRAEGGRGLFTFVRVGLFYYTFLTIVCAICEAHKTVAKLSKMPLNSSDGDPGRKEWWPKKTQQNSLTRRIVPPPPLHYDAGLFL